MQHINGDDVRYIYPFHSSDKKTYRCFTIIIYSYQNSLGIYALGSCRYLHFDFHHICGHIHFERLAILYEQMEDFLDKNGYYSFPPPQQ